MEELRNSGNQKTIQTLKSMEKVNTLAKKEYDFHREIQETFETLTILLPKVKTEGVKESIEK